VKLTTNEKEILEELFQMRGGCVLNFSDRTFGEFFQNDMALNIFDPAKLPEVSEKARERVQMGDEGYPLITPQNAAAAVGGNALKRGRGDDNIQVHPFIPICADRSSHWSLIRSNRVIFPVDNPV